MAFSSFDRRVTRRQMLKWTGQAALAAGFAPQLLEAASESSGQPSGAIVGDAIAAKVGERMLRDGGNAIDAAIAAAFAAGIVTPRNCGVGGYGGHAMVALAGGKKVVAIDFTSTAPAAARPDMFPLDAAGKVKGNVNTVGWLAAGVPGTLAGLELVLQRYGTRSLRDVLAPAIELCESGTYAFPVKGIDDVAAKGAAKDAAAAPPEKQRSAALARLLKTLAARNTGESFYRGDLAQTIAAAFARNGGIVTAADLAAYKARELTPLAIDWNGARIHTVPLPATGLLLLEAFSILKAIDWPRLGAAERQHAKLEALRLAWADRLRLFGDPDQVQVPVEQLLSAAYTRELAAKVTTALRDQKPVPLDVDPSHAGGTTNLSAVDRQGNMIAITLTHGGSFGARVTVPELGLWLGHGMSRFDPRPGRPNSPAAGKRPITNMCPSVVTRAGTPVLAVGGAGGTRIPNSLYEVLLNSVGLGASLERALAAPRIDANGTLAIGLEKTHSADDEAFFRKLGYKTTRGPSAYIGGATFDPATGATQALASGGL